MDNIETWIKNLSFRQLIDTEKTVLVRGLNYNCRDTKNTDFVAALELTLKNTRLTEEIQQTIRQTIVPTLSRKEFLNIIKDTRIEEDEIMVSFDITALFTSTNIDLAKETIATLLDKSGRQAPNDTNSIIKDSTLKLLDLCLTTHFIFNDQIFRQINGTPMGSPISGLIAEVVMQ
eukprot:g42108.t1